LFSYNFAPGKFLGCSGVPLPRHQQKIPRGPGFGFGFAVVGAGLFGFGFGFVSWRLGYLDTRIRFRFRNQTEFRPLRNTQFQVSFLPLNLLNSKGYIFLSSLAWRAPAFAFSFKLFRFGSNQKEFGLGKGDRWGVGGRGNYS
jgi:hypothetical protein